MPNVVFRGSQSEEDRRSLRVIAGVTAIPRGEIGAIHLQATKTLVDVAEPRVALVLKKLNGIQFKDRKLLVRVAS